MLFVFPVVTSPLGEKWPNAGGEMKVLLPNAMAEDLDRDGELAEIASQTKEMTWAMDRNFRKYGQKMTET